VAARWRLNAAQTLTLACNLGDRPVAMTDMPFETPIWGEAMSGGIPPKSTLAWISQA
jgi:hypothetical protein